MLLRIRLQKELLLSRFLRNVIPDRYGVRRAPFKEYIPLYQAAKLLGQSHVSVINQVIKSKTVHGYDLREGFFLHPDGVTRLVATHYQKLISRTLRSDPCDPVLH